MTTCIQEAMLVNQAMMEGGGGGGVEHPTLLWLFFDLFCYMYIYLFFLAGQRGRYTNDALALSGSVRIGPSVWLITITFSFLFKGKKVSLPHHLHWHWH